MKRIIFIMISCLTVLSCNKGDDSLSFPDQLDKDIKTIDSYLQAHSITSNKDQSGIRFVINKMGTGGLPPTGNNTVIVKYVGSILGTSTIFDQNNEGLSGYLSGLIPGMQLGLLVMPKGTKATLYIPSGLAYGTSQNGVIPPNSNLVFDLELVDVIRSSTESNQFVQDLSKIDDYLKDSANVITDTTGLRYVVKEAGSGAQPSWYDKVSLKYTGKIMATGVTFFDGSSMPSSGFDSRVVDYLQGFVVGLQKMKKGGKARFYIPSTLGFGAKVAGSAAVQIPANSNLIYDVELVDVIQ